MEKVTILIFLFVVATAVAMAVRRLHIPYTVALVFTGIVLGLSHAFDAPQLTKVLLFSIFLPGLLFEDAFHIEFKRFWRNRTVLKYHERLEEKGFQIIVHGNEKDVNKAKEILDRHRESMQANSQ